MQKSKRYVPPSTAASNRWAMGIFKQFLSSEGIGKDFTECTTEEKIQLLSKFVISTQKKDGKPYPGTSLRSLLCGVIRHHNDTTKTEKISIFSDPAFEKVKNALDNMMVQRKKDGTTKKRRRAEPLSVEEEKKIIEATDTNTPGGLLYRVFLSNRR